VDSWKREDALSSPNVLNLLKYYCASLRRHEFRGGLTATTPFSATRLRSAGDLLRLYVGPASRFPGAPTWRCRVRL
jgi:hypothetical protein